MAGALCCVSYCRVSTLEILKPKSFVWIVQNKLQFGCCLLVSVLFFFLLEGEVLVSMFLFKIYLPSVVLYG